MVFIHPTEEEITGEVIDKFIKLHQAEIPRYLRLKELYESRGPILEQEEKTLDKPDNRLVVNNAKQLVDSYNGYFIGIPVKVNHENENIADFIKNFRNINDMDDNESELSKIAAIYGHGFEYIFQDEDTVSRCIYNTPLDMFIVYDDTIQQNPLFAVRWYVTDDGYEGQLFTTDKEAKIVNDGKDTIITDEEDKHFGGVPIIEWLENEERTSVFEPVETLINAYNKALSEKANDVDYFADAYLALLGAELDEKGSTKIRDNRIINLFGEVDASKIIVKFLDKPDGDATQEHLLDRIERLIYEKSMVANINDESFGNATGVALEFKLQPMKNLAINKERKVKSAMSRRFKLLFNLVTNVPAAMKDEWLNLEYTFTRNIPRNVADEAEIAANLQGVVSEETQLKVLSIVDNVQDEIAKKKAEREAEAVDYPTDENRDFLTTNKTLEAISKMPEKHRDAAKDVLEGMKRS